jgi:small subunit ribosomal protein S4
MAVDRVPVLKRCRSLDLDPIYLGIDKKSNRESKRANKKISEYGLQLREKQKAKFIYGVLEKPFRNYYDKAERLNGQTGENLMILLERRLDNVIFRLGFARTRKEARQIVDHKHVLVNGKCVNIPSYLVKAGDVVEIREKNKGDNHYKLVLETTAGRLVPAWLESDHENLKGEIKTLPTREEIDVPVNEMLIVELLQIIHRSGFYKVSGHFRPDALCSKRTLRGICQSIPKRRGFLCSILRNQTLRLLRFPKIKDTESLS